MKITLRKSQDRGFADHGWLKSRHTFSFADYHDPQQMGFGVLRVINEDQIDGGAGFGTHGHRDMEIVSYVVDGILEHKDSMGNSTFIRPGEVQRMTAGTGVRHSEYNHLKDRPSHFLQIWILPAKNGLNPSYDQKSFLASLSTDAMVLVASPTGEQGSITIHQDVKIFASKGDHAHSTWSYELGSQRSAWIQVISGPVKVNDLVMESGDGASISEEGSIQIGSPGPREFIFFDLPKNG